MDVLDYDPSSMAEPFTVNGGLFTGKASIMIRAAEDALPKDIPSR